jgi:hypothetical protein
MLSEEKEMKEKAAKRWREAERCEASPEAHARLSEAFVLVVL